MLQLPVPPISSKAIFRTWPGTAYLLKTQLMEGIAPEELHRNPLALRGTRLKVAASPPWTIRRKVKNLQRVDGYPVTMLLLDRQFAPDESARYTRYVRRLETPQAVQEAGRIEFDFDPATQLLLIHAISIFREGELTNYAELDQIEVIQRERDLDKGIYAGNITALVLLQDLRTGDIIDVESSTVSTDVLFPNHHWFSENFEHLLPVGRQYFSWLTKDHKPFTVSQQDENLETKLSEEETEWGLRKTWSRENVSALDLPPLLPIGFNPFEEISITSFDSWAEVASEIARLWERAENPGKDLPLELATLKKEHPNSDVDLIEAVMAFVRDRVRYQGVEIGRLGLIPEDLGTIWERRFGDCKEKTSLLCWLLRECGFDAHPALVSVSLRGKVTERLPAPIFDHVVVSLTHNKHQYWIDPTVISQRGSLATWNSLPFQKALLISKDTTDFLQIDEAPPKQDFIQVFETYYFEGNDASLSVRQEFHGAEANAVRGMIDSNGRSVIQKMFTEIVKSTRSEAELQTDLEVFDDPTANILVLSGEFRAPKTLRLNPQSGRMVCEFIPYAIIEKIHGINKSDRTFALGLRYPTEVFHTIEINHPDAKGVVVPKTIINNSFLEFEAGTKNENTLPTLCYHYRAKAAEVPVKDLHRYRLNLEQISAAISLIFETSPGRDSSSKAVKHTCSWEDEELEPQSFPHQGRQPFQERDGGGWSVPVWLYLVVGAIIVKIILLIVGETIVN
ncbi:MAG: transglutaminase-like putative cysteine protease [Akkermansiaceae bacterium]